MGSVLGILVSQESRVSREEGAPTRGETGVVARLSSRVCRLELQGRGW